jgi:hypothetical protein
MRSIPQERRPLAIAPRGGAIGTEVALSATGLPPLSSFLIAFANLQNYQLLQRVATDADGAFATKQVVPPWAVLDGAHYFFASFSDEIPRAFSLAFHVTAADGAARVDGTVGDRADGCVDLNAGEVLYHLTGDVGDVQKGDRILVRGTLVDTAPCGGTGIVVAATSVARRPG